MKEIEEILKNINNLVGFTDNQLNLIKDIVAESYNLGLKEGDL